MTAKAKFERDVLIAMIKHALKLKDFVEDRYGNMVKVSVGTIEENNERVHVKVWTRYKFQKISLRKERKRELTAREQLAMTYSNDKTTEWHGRGSAYYKDIDVSDNYVITFRETI